MLYKIALLKQQFIFRVRCFKVEDTFDSRSVYAIEVHPKADIYEESLVLVLCTDHMKKCCTTSALNHVYGGYSMTLDGPLLRDCEGFQIIDNEYSVYFQGTWNLMYAANYLEAVDLYSSRFKMISPMDTCFPNTHGFCKVTISIKLCPNSLSLFNDDS